ncbi:protein kinase [Frankia sp. CNm7]|uniref:Protein kinase n=1 Tax=Frankia nepalensis TaxID=1836974 RepID=A0A937RBN7_9ACTN|nr:serine/threonine-protein kinase [Frankia nepalensis]MBL7499621.1 protein kinase [Frankia nepalensis]MBL7514544.1 protein kinase [Frankia nepalensis]MBL7522219.1 protein kinase [Frankia nepalensis]MBL7626847.1 protein kinase [Frankia nepalensis]
MTDTGVRLQEPRPSDPTSLGRHRVLGRLGGGGMGVVYLADGPFGRVAVKLIREELADDPDFRRRFQREVQACFRVGGTRTARLVDFELDAARPWLATEFVDAPSLSDHVRAHGKLAADEQLVLAAGLAEALLSIHSAGLVHRDLKPSNVLWTPHGPKVIDFGIAAAADAANLTSSGQFVGTPGWHSPEQVSGQEATGAADIFAWGALLCYAASGTAPFGSGSVEVVLHRVVTGEPSIDRELIAPELRDLVAATMARDPADRPTAADLYTALVGTVPDGVSAPATRILESRPGDTPPSTPTGLPAAGGVARTPPWSATVAGGRAEPPAPARRRHRRLVIGLAVGAVVLLAAAGTAVGLLLNGGGGSEDSDPGEVMFSATEPWRLTIDDQRENGGDVGCTVDITELVSGETLRIPDMWGRKTFQVAQTGDFHWDVNDDACVVTGTAGSGEVALPFAQRAYEGDTLAFEAQGPVIIKSIKELTAEESCDLTLRAVDGRTLDIGTLLPGQNGIELNPGEPTTVYLAESPCDVRVSAGW